MLWVKSFHIVFIASWFAGLFYLPRIFVNLAMVPAGSDAERARLLLMARKLMRFTTLLMVPAVALGYHHACGRVLRKFEAGTSQRSHVWFRWFNEAPVLMLVAIVVLVVVKPF